MCMSASVYCITSDSLLTPPAPPFPPLPVSDLPPHHRPSPPPSPSFPSLYAPSAEPQEHKLIRLSKLAPTLITPPRYSTVPSSVPSFRFQLPARYVPRVRLSVPYRRSMPPFCTAVPLPATCTVRAACPAVCSVPPFHAAVPHRRSASSYLRGTCRVSGCPFSHAVSADKMPACRYFLRGMCRSDVCMYRHVNVGRDASICDDFVSGFCQLGDSVSNEMRELSSCSTFGRIPMIVVAVRSNSDNYVWRLLESYEV